MIPGVWDIKEVKTTARTYSLAAAVLRYCNLSEMEAMQPLSAVPAQRLKSSLKFFFYSYITTVYKDVQGIREVWATARTYSSYSWQRCCDAAISTSAAIQPLSASTCTEFKDAQF
jgi:hypothetical protein